MPLFETWFFFPGERLGEQKCQKWKMMGELGGTQKITLFTGLGELGGTLNLIFFIPKSCNDHHFAFQVIFMFFDLIFIVFYNFRPYL